MLRALAFGFAVGAAVQAWRAWPPGSMVTADSLAVVFCAGLVAAYFAGKRAARGLGPVAVATASASAESHATNSVQLAVIVPGHGPNTVPNGVQVPTEAAQWFASTSTVPELTADALDGMDLAELLDERDTQTG